MKYCSIKILDISHVLGLSLEIAEGLVANKIESTPNKINKIRKVFVEAALLTSAAALDKTETSSWMSSNSPERGITRVKKRKEQMKINFKEVQIVLTFRRLVVLLIRTKHDINNANLLNNLLIEMWYYLKRRKIFPSHFLIKNFNTPQILS